MNLNWRFKVILESSRSSRGPRPLLPPGCFQVWTDSEPNSSARKGKKEKLQVQATAVDTLEDAQPRCEPALRPTSRPSVCSHVALRGSSQRKKRRRRRLMHPSASSPSVSVSAPSFICLISPRLPQRSLRWHPVFHSSPIPIFNLYPLSRRHRSRSARPSFTLFSAPLSSSLCVFFFSHPLKLHY